MVAGAAVGVATGASNGLGVVGGAVTFGPSVGIGSIRSRHTRCTSVGGRGCSMEGCVDRCDKDGGYGNRDDAAHQSGNRHALCSAAKTACPSYAYGTEDDCQWAEHKSEKVEVWDEGENET